jgi:hypothetical protein
LAATVSLEAVAADPPNELRAPDPEAVKRVRPRVLEVWAEPAASVWLFSHNVHLGARPVDALALGREQDVLDALDLAAYGGY